MRAKPATDAWSGNRASGRREGRRQGRGVRRVGRHFAVRGGESCDANARQLGEEHRQGDEQRCAKVAVPCQPIDVVAVVAEREQHVHDERRRDVRQP